MSEHKRLERIVKLISWRLDEATFPHAFDRCACEMCVEIRKWRATKPEKGSIRIDPRPLPPEALEGLRRLVDEFDEADEKP